MRKCSQTLSLRKETIRNFHAARVSIELGTPAQRVIEGGTSVGEIVKGGARVAAAVLKQIAGLTDPPSACVITGCAC